MGLFLGIVLAFVRERVDPRIRDRSAVEEILGTPVLAAIPPGKGTRVG